ncbi:MAG: SOS response-associated peptidase [Firmicutes bacterium]|nr:SOS response-associated peptidase [Bacillota bacterium]
MCGRYTLFTEEDNQQIKQILEHLKNHPQRPNMKTGEIFPTNLAPIVINNKENQFDILKWGFEFNSLIINARSETIFEKRTFMEPIKTQRCLIPATGFYEWDKSKNKYHFTLKKDEPLFMAGIYRKNHFVIITTKANESLEAIHDRMPVIIEEKNKEDWLFDNGATLALLNQKQPLLNEQLVIKE